jgi:hypothetical protein
MLFSAGGVSIAQPAVSILPDRVLRPRLVLCDGVIADRRTTAVTAQALVGVTRRRTTSSGSYSPTMPICGTSVLSGDDAAVEKGLGRGGLRARGHAIELLDADWPVVEPKGPARSHPSRAMTAGHARLTRGAVKRALTSQWPSADEASCVVCPASPGTPPPGSDPAHQRAPNHSANNPHRC